MAKWWQRFLGRKGRRAKRSYYAAKSTRFTTGWQATDQSADGELVNDLRTMRGRSRALCRDNSYAKRARQLCVSNIVGSGIGMQAQVMADRENLRTLVNDEIEHEWKLWTYADACHTGGRLSFAQIEQVAVSQLFEAGEIYVRIHLRPFGRSRVPLALELVEPERVADELHQAGREMANANGNLFRMGHELDRFHRPVAYWFRQRHQNDTRWTGERDEIFRVAAEDVIHLAVLNRWPQTRGEPWMHTSMRRLQDLDGFVEAEVIRARAQAMRMGIIESGAKEPLGDEDDTDGNREVNMEPGEVLHLNPGETWKDSMTNSPNPNADPFCRYLIRDIASGLGISYAPLSGDFSQSNYSSSRLSLLEDRDIWRMLQSWFICEFRRKVHELWMRQAVYARTLSTIGVAEYVARPEKFCAVKFKPRGWGWVDPTKEVQAFKDAVRCTFMTIGDVLSMSGQDIEEVFEARAREIAYAKKLGLVSDADPSQVAGSGAEQKPEPVEKPEGGGADAESEESESEDESEEQDERRIVRLITR